MEMMNSKCYMIHTEFSMWITRWEVINTFNRSRRTIPVDFNNLSFHRWRIKQTSLSSSQKNQTQLRKPALQTTALQSHVNRFGDNLSPGQTLPVWQKHFQKKSIACPLCKQQKRGRFSHGCRSWLSCAKTINPPPHPSNPRPQLKIGHMWKGHFVTSDKPAAGSHVLPAFLCVSINLTLAWVITQEVFTLHHHFRSDWTSGHYTKLHWAQGRRSRQNLKIEILWQPNRDNTQ